jgi:DNA invertase Pin-like site-specific DNA recombinase
MGVFAEFERSMIQERVRAGLARAKAAGKTFGRPRIDGATEKDIRQALRKGDIGMRKIAAEFAWVLPPLQRIAREMPG